MSDNFVPLTSIVQALAKHLESMQSGLFFIVTDDNKLGRVILRSGKIVKVDFANSQGADAVSLLSKVVRGRHRFEKGNYGEQDDSVFLPETPDILSSLRGNTETSVAGAKTQVAGSAISNEEKQKIEQVLTDIIGPMAGMICEDVFEQYTNKGDILHQISLELDEEDKVVFQQKIDL